jgi:hypothetical protein
MAARNHAGGKAASTTETAIETCDHLAGSLLAPANGRQIQKRSSCRPRSRPFDRMMKIKKN